MDQSGPNIDKRSFFRLYRMKILVVI